MKLDPQVKLPVLKSQKKKATTKGQAHTVDPKNHTKSSNSLYSGSKTFQPLPEEEIKERSLKICRFITEPFHKNLRSNDPDAQKALKYLTEERGLTVKMICEREIGFCQKKAMFLDDSRINYKYSCSIEHVNKIVPLDSFENDIVFPIRDPETGDVVSFQARRVGEDGQGRKHSSKNNECYTKSENLYLMYESRNAIQDKGYVVLVEGVFDALLEHQNGNVNSVALLGCDIFDKQIALIKKCFPIDPDLIKNGNPIDHYKKCRFKVWLFLDKDPAGIEASKKIKEKLEKVGLSVIASTERSSEWKKEWKDQADWWIRPNCIKILPPSTYFWK